MDKPVRYSATKAIREDRRRNVRYLITGTVWFQWLAADGNWYNAIGTTRDCGKEGLFIQSDSRPPMASPLRLVVTLPTTWKSGTSLCLSGTGCVRHIQREPRQASGFGASAVFHTEVPISAVK